DRVVPNLLLYLLPVVFLVIRAGDVGVLHSFPTRRSSDLLLGTEKVPVFQFCRAWLVFAAPSSRCRNVAAICPILARSPSPDDDRSEEHTSELQSREKLVCRLLREKKNQCSITLHRLVQLI